MQILAFQGSPRIYGNTSILLDNFLSQAEEMGARCIKIDVAKIKVSPCMECGVCEREGFCPLEDDMQGIYPLIWKADLIILATPIFFYGPTAQIKAVIDRSQVLWVRKYIKKLDDPGRGWRKGIFLAVGATRGKNLFDGSKLVAKYFFDACGASYTDDICVREVEEAGEIKKRKEVLKEAKKKASEIMEEYKKKKKILFLCKENACRSQMAWAFFKKYYGDKFDVRSAGSYPAEKINPLMVKVMEEKGIDMAYIKPVSIEDVLQEITPDILVTMGCEENCPFISGVKRIDWNIQDPANSDLNFMRKIRDIINREVIELYKNLC